MNLTTRTHLAINAGSIAALAPTFILGPTLAAGQPLTPWHWGALVIGLSAALGLVAYSLHRERLARSEAREAERQRARKIAEQILSEKIDRPAPPAAEESARAERDSSD